MDCSIILLIIFKLAGGYVNKKKKLDKLNVISDRALKYLEILLSNISESSALNFGILTF